MKVNKIIRRAIALRNARDRANNDEFKKLWDKKLVQLILEWKEYNRLVLVLVCLILQSVAVLVVIVQSKKLRTGKQ